MLQVTEADQAEGRKLRWSCSGSCHSNCNCHGNGNGNNNGNGNCFPGDAVVTLAGGRRVPMRQLKVGDRVLTASPGGAAPAFEDVYFFGHQDAGAAAAFVALTVCDAVSGATRVLELTPRHFVPVVRASAKGVAGSGACESLAAGAVRHVYAGDVAPGDVLQMVLEDNSTAACGTVVAVREGVVKAGLYNPYTKVSAGAVPGTVRRVGAGASGQGPATPP